VPDRLRDSGSNDIDDIIHATMKIQVLALDGVFDTGLSALLDTFAVANDLAGMERIKAPPFQVTLVGVRKRVRTAQGLLVPLQTPTTSARADVVVLPALGAKSPAPLRDALARRDVADACALMTHQHKRGARVGAACTGTFVLAASGLLDGQAATTSWWLAPMFRELYPRVALDESRMLVSGQGCVTAGAALAHLDLALWLVRQASPALAALAARYLLVDSRPSQAVFMIPDHLAHSDPLVERFEVWARSAMARGFSLSDAARASGASERTLARRLRTVLGKSPLSYFQELRVERAVHLLRTTAATVDDIAAQVGYADGVTLRTLLRRKLGKGVRELRIAM
jgi:transcriptional regulator GlxA family with amidase domain